MPTGPAGASNNSGVDALKSIKYKAVVLPLTISIVNELSSLQFGPQNGLYASGVARAKA